MFQSKRKAWWLAGLAALGLSYSSYANRVFEDSFESLSADNIMTGYFIDAAVEGLNYRSASIAGITGKDGAFRYVPGEEIIFSIGDIDIGRKTGQHYVNLFDLSDTYVDIDNASLRIAQLLLSLDVDGDPDNGIKLDLHYASENYGDDFSFDSQASQYEYERQALKLLREINPNKYSLVDLTTTAQHVYDNLRSTDEYCLYPENSWDALTGYKNNVNITPTCEMRQIYQVYNAYVRPDFIKQAEILTDNMEGLTEAELRYEQAKRHILSNVTSVRDYVDTMTTSIDTLVNGSEIFTPTQKDKIIQNSISIGALINGTVGPLVEKLFTDNENENAKLVKSYSGLISHALSVVVNTQKCVSPNQTCSEALGKEIRALASEFGIDDKNASAFEQQVLDSSEFMSNILVLLDVLDVSELTGANSKKAMLKLKSGLIQVGANSFNMMFTRDYSLGSHFFSKEMRNEMEKTANTIASTAKCSTVIAGDVKSLTDCVDAVGGVIDLTSDLFKAAIQTPKWRNVELNGNSNLVTQDVMDRYVGFETHRDQLAQAYGLNVDFSAVELVRAVAKQDRNLKTVEDCSYKIPLQPISGVFPFCVGVDENDVVEIVYEKIDYLNDLLEIRKMGWENILLIDAPLTAHKNEAVTFTLDLSKSDLTTSEISNWGTLTCVADGSQYTESSPFTINNPLATSYPMQLSFNSMGLQQVSCQLRNNASAGGQTVAFNKHYIGISAQNSDAVLYGVTLDSPQVGELMTLTARGQNLNDLAISTISGCSFNKTVKSAEEVVFSCTPTVSHLQPVTVDISANGEVLASPSFSIYPSNKVTVSLDKASYTVKPSDYDSQFFTIKLSGIDYPVVVQYYLIDTSTAEILALDTATVDEQVTIRFPFDNNVLLDDQDRQFEVGVIEVRAPNKRYETVSAPVNFIALNNDQASSVVVSCGNAIPCEYQLSLPTLTNSTHKYMTIQSISPSGELSLSDAGKVLYEPNRGFSGIAKAEAIYQEAAEFFTGVYLPVSGGKSVKKIIWFNVAEDHTAEPKLTVSAPDTATVGSQISLSASVTDFEDNCFNYLFVNWDDGTTSTINSENDCKNTMQVTHTYTDTQASSYQIKVSASNTKGVSDVVVHELSMSGSGGTVVAIPTKLNDTGITKCGTAGSSSNTADCSSAVVGASGSQVPLGQDGHYGTGKGGSTGMSFTTTNGGDCVLDNHTGLLWEVKKGGDGTKGNEGLHDADDTYNWYSDTNNHGYAGVKNDDGAICHGYDSNSESTFCNTQAYVARVNAQGLCGHNDGWRLPTRKELRSIVDYSRTNPAIDTTYFSQTKNSYYWSSSPYAYYNGSAWSVKFNHGHDVYYYKSDSRYVRLVRGGQ